MRQNLLNLLPKRLVELANACDNPLFVVGGAVRDYLAGLESNGAKDWDICSPMPFEAFLNTAKKLGFEIKSIFKNTGTVKCKDLDGVEYEYTSFRSDKYVRGVHVPIETFFTDDISLDAKRRDFTCNAVYFDIQKGELCDPLGGIPAIEEKRLTTVAPADKVFSEDGLRLMRLARQAGQLGFTPDSDCLQGAANHAELIDDISPERIYTELCAILSADKKYGVKDGHYKGLKLLEQTGVLARIFPDLAKGKNMAQRADFHKYDVLEHSLRAAWYANEQVRLAALLHDIGKPFCTIRDGNSYAHHEEGAKLAKAALIRLKAPKRLIERIPALIEWHMYDFNCQTGENKLRRFFVQHYPILEDLLALKQADFSACTDDFSVAPTCARWRALLEKMKNEGAPLTLKELALSGKELLDLGIPAPKISQTLQALLLHAACNPKDNTKERLLKLAPHM